MVSLVSYVSRTLNILQLWHQLSPRYNKWVRKEVIRKLGVYLVMWEECKLGSDILRFCHASMELAFML